jgi:predicted esterase
MKQQSLLLQSLHQAQFRLQKGPDESGRLYILNHGYNSSNESVWKMLIDKIPPGSHVLASNAPYPIPTRNDDGWQVGYSWFFYNNFTDSYLIGYDICKDFIKKLCEALGFANNPKTLVGFSQGGYAAPHMATHLRHVDHVIGIGCRFRHHDLPWPENLKLEAVHGEEDHLVECQGAYNSFQKIPETYRGRWHSFPGVGHWPSPEMLKLIGHWLSTPPH